MSRAPRIALIEPGGVRREVPITTTPFRIGRQAGNELTLRDSRISRQQAQIINPEGVYVLEDMGSRHGTYVNGQKVLRHELQPKDSVDFGMTDSYSFIFLGDTATIEELLGKSGDPGAYKFRRARALSSRRFARSGAHAGHRSFARGCV